MTAAKFISDLVAGGRYCFSAEERIGLEAQGSEAFSRQARVQRSLSE